MPEQELVPFSPLEGYVPLTDEPPPQTPDFTGQQGYLDAAPGGIDARYAWTVPGGTGVGVQIIDMEGAWQFTHEDLLQNQGGVAGSTSPRAWRTSSAAPAGSPAP
jgi:hypothetical protein